MKVIAIVRPSSAISVSGNREFISRANSSHVHSLLPGTNNPDAALRNRRHCAVFTRLTIQYDLLQLSVRTR